MVTVPVLAKGRVPSPGGEVYFTVGASHHRGKAPLEVPSTLPPNSPEASCTPRGVVGELACFPAAGHSCERLYCSRNCLSWAIACCQVQVCARADS